MKINLSSISIILVCHISKGGSVVWGSGGGLWGFGVTTPFFKNCFILNYGFPFRKGLCNSKRTNLFTKCCWKISKSLLLEYNRDSLLSNENIGVSDEHLGVSNINLRVPWWEYRRGLINNLGSLNKMYGSPMKV